MAPVGAGKRAISSRIARRHSIRSRKEPSCAGTLRLRTTDEHRSRRASPRGGGCRCGASRRGDGPPGRHAKRTSGCPAARGRQAHRRVRTPGCRSPGRSHDRSCRAAQRDPRTRRRAPNAPRARSGGRVDCHGISSATAPRQSGTSATRRLPRTWRRFCLRSAHRCLHGARAASARSASRSSSRA